MKLLKRIAVVGLTCLFLMACSEQDAVTTGAVDQPQSPTPSPVATAAPEEPSEIDGTLTRTEKGLALVTDTDTYVVAGQDLSEMLGKKVKITGAIAEIEETRIIQVLSVIPIE